MVKEDSSSENHSLIASSGQALTRRSEALVLRGIRDLIAQQPEAQLIFELSQGLGASLNLDEALSMFSAKIKRLVPYDAVAIYLRLRNELLPEFITGDNIRLLAPYLRIPVGEGVSGWVAQNRKPIINGDPLAEPGHFTVGEKQDTMRSALAVPLEGRDGIVGVLTLYGLKKDAFTADHLRVLLAVNSEMALFIENALEQLRSGIRARSDSRE